MRWRRQQPTPDEPVRSDGPVASGADLDEVSEATTATDMAEPDPPGDAGVAVDLRLADVPSTDAQPAQSAGSTTDAPESIDIFGTPAHAADQSAAGHQVWAPTAAEATAMGAQAGADGTADADLVGGTPAGAHPADAPAGDRAERDRRQLIELLIYAWDRARSPGVWERLTEGLAAVGVSVERPDGQRFDPTRHEVGGVEITDDDGKIDLIAETELAGFTDRGVVLRDPVVVVYRRE